MVRWGVEAEAIADYLPRDHRGSGQLRSCTALSMMRRVFSVPNAPKPQRYQGVLETALSIR